MYLAYWQLDRRPFEVGCDTAAYYPGESHQAALLKLRYTIENARGVAVLAGESGSGKTLVARVLGTQLPAECSPLVHLVYPMEAAELLAYVAAELAPGDHAFKGLDHTIRVISTHLVDNAAQGRHAVLVIDEAHLLEAETLAALRLLLNFEDGARPAVSLLLIGQTTLLPMIERIRDLNERIGMRCLLRPLSIDETLAYVEHRLRAAGAKRRIFTHEALEHVHELTHGNARQINRLCDLALLLAYAEEHHEIGRTEMEAVSQELTLVAAE